MTTWPTTEEVLAAKDAFEMTMPDWVQPEAYAIGLQRGEESVDWRVVNHPNTHELPAIVLAVVTDHRTGNATHDMSIEQLDRAILMLGPAGDCQTWQHPNLWAWQALRTELGPEPDMTGTTIYAVFVGSTTNPIQDEPQRQLLASIGLT